MVTPFVTILVLFKAIVQSFAQYFMITPSVCNSNSICEHCWSILVLFKAFVQSFVQYFITPSVYDSNSICEHSSVI